MNQTTSNPTNKESTIRLVQIYPVERRFWGNILWWACLTAILCILVCWRVEQLPDFSICLWHNLTGLKCPSCGMGRALLLLFEGRLAQAVASNPFVMITAPLIILLWTKYSLELLGKIRVCLRISQKVLRWGYLVLAGLATIYCIIRNF